MIALMQLSMLQVSFDGGSWEWWEERGSQAACEDKRESCFDGGFWGSRGKIAFFRP